MSSEEHETSRVTPLRRAVIRSFPQARAGLDLPVLPARGDRLLSILRQMRAWIIEMDATGEPSYFSPSIEDVLGWTPDEALDSDNVQIHEDDLPALAAAARVGRTTGQSTVARFRLQHKLGHWVWIEASTLPWYPSPEGEYHAVSLCRDITEAVEAEQARRESEERYRVVTEMSRDVICELAADGRAAYVNPGVLEVLGYTAEEIIELPPFALTHPEDLERVRGELRQGVANRSPIRVENLRIHNRDGEWLVFESTGLVYTRADGEVRLLTVNRDVTERLREEERRRELEQQVQRAQKLESLGILAGGVAHDFNNLLTPILGAASLGLTEISQDSPVYEKLLTIQRAAERAAALTHQMLSYAGKGPLRVEPVDLSSVVREMGQLAASAVSGRTVLDFELDPELPPIEADTAQLGQVVINLISNAAEALGEGQSRITVRTGTVDLDAPPAGALFADALNRGRHVYFEVVDTGCGMTAETAARIFDPFFTTKFTGRGLGLAAVAGIVRGHRGAIEIDSAPDRGTCFRVLLPAAEAGDRRSVARRKAPAPWRGTGMILVIDDDEGVRDFVRHVLTRTGLTVVEAADANAGIDCFRKHADEIRLVLLDRTMPRAVGGEVIEELRSIRKDAAIMLVSGYSEEQATAEVTGGLAGFLQKPFLPETLLERVREILEE